MNFINNQRLAELAGVSFNSEEIKPGPIVYSRTHEVVKQFPKLATFPPCVLVTSFSDACVTDSMADKLPMSVKTWYSNNVDTDNPRVVPVPIGIRYSMENEKILRQVMDSPAISCKNLCYVNFLIYKKGNVRGNEARCGLYERFRQKGWMTIEGGLKHIPIQDYYESIKRHCFVISPPGAGPDCHRHWESLYLGAIPIVFRSRAMERIMEGIPCVFVRDWEEVSGSFLAQTLNTMSNHSFPALERLDMDYWKERITEDAKIF